MPARRSSHADDGPLVAIGIDPRHRSVNAVRDPDRPEADRDGSGSVPNRCLARQLRPLGIDRRKSVCLDPLGRIRSPETGSDNGNDKSKKSNRAHRDGGDNGSRSRAARPRVFRRHIERKRDLVDTSFLGQSFYVHAAAIDVRHVVHLAREVHKPLAHEDLPRAREAAEARREIERPASVAPRHGHRLTGVEADAYAQRKILGSNLLDEPLLKCNGGANRAPRGAEDDERLVTAEFDETAVRAFDHTLDDLGERPSETSRRFVAVLLRVPGVPANVGD